MTSRSLLLPFVGLALLASSIGADEPKLAAKRPDVFDIVPADAMAAIAIRDVTELIKRGDTLIERTELKVPFRLSDGYNFVVSYLGIHEGVDRSGAAALMMIKVAGDKAAEFQGLVLSVPVKDMAAIAKGLKVDRAELMEGKVIDRHPADKAASGDVRYVAVRGQHVLLGLSEKHVAAAAKAKTLREVLPAGDVAGFAQDDILVYADVTQTKDDWGPGVRDLKREFTKVAPDEAAALQQLLEASQDLRYAMAGIRLDEGLKVTVSLGFDGDRSREILARLQGAGKATTSLAGLPVERMIASHAACGQGENTAALARGLLHHALLQSQLDTQQFVSAGHRANVVGVFGEVWQRLEGSRVALYENEDAERHGYFSLVAILATDDAEKFVADMTSLSRFINAADFSLDDAAKMIDAETIAEVISQLGDEDYATRQTASTKLGLIGPAALPALAKAEQSSDPETRLRAQLLRGQIHAELAGEKQNLLKGDLLTRLQPQLVFFPKAERRAERPIDIVQLRLRDDEASQAVQLRRMFGPDWNKVRLATVGKDVVVLLGSETALLEQTIKNATADVRPLADRIRSRLPEELTAEFHLSLTRARQLVAPAAELKSLGDEPAPLTSFGLQIAPQRLRLDLFAPYDEIKDVVKQMNW